MATTDFIYAKCCCCKGSSFGQVHIVVVREVEWPHVICLDCGTVQYLMLTKGWSLNGWCGDPLNHYPKELRPLWRVR